MVTNSTQAPPLRELMCKREAMDLIERFVKELNKESRPSALKRLKQGIVLKL